MGDGRGWMLARGARSTDSTDSTDSTGSTGSTGSTDSIDSIDSTGSTEGCGPRGMEDVLAWFGSIFVLRGACGTVCGEGRGDG